MEQVQVLIATMHQKDHSLLDRMNIQTDAVVINQCDYDAYEEFEYRGKNIIYVSTTERGLSNSRNLALSYAKGDYLVIADEDVTYEDGYEKLILEAFRECPQADIMAFQTEAVNCPPDRKTGMALHTGPAPKRKTYNSVRLVIRGAAVRESGIRFNPLFGTGAKYHSGEDSVFVMDARKCGLCIYENEKLLAKVDFSGSSWFHGYDEAYFFDKGAWLACAYPKTASFMRAYFILRLWKQSDLSVRMQLKAMKMGIQDYRRTINT